MPLLVSLEGRSALPSSLRSDHPCCRQAYLQGQCLLRPHTARPQKDGGDLGAEGSPASCMLSH